MSDYFDRLIDERNELEKKLDKLDDFLVSKESYNVEPEQLALLKVQATAMNTYLQCLVQRIEFVIKNRLKA